MAKLSKVLRARASELSEHHRPDVVVHVLRFTRRARMECGMSERDSQHTHTHTHAYMRACLSCLRACRVVPCGFVCDVRGRRCQLSWPFIVQVEFVDGELTNGGIRWNGSWCVCVLVYANVRSFGLSHVRLTSVYRHRKSNSEPYHIWRQIGNGSGIN